MLTLSAHSEHTHAKVPPHESDIEVWLLLNANVVISAPCCSFCLTQTLPSTWLRRYLSPPITIVHLQTIISRWLKMKMHFCKLPIITLGVYCFDVVRPSQLKHMLGYLANCINLRMCSLIICHI